MQKPNFLIKSLSKATTQNWRTQNKQTNLITQISTILTQRHNWPTLFKTLNINHHNITSSTFLQILNNTKTQPRTILSFFKWCIKHTSFQPDITVQCKLTHLLILNGFENLSKPILDSLIKTYPCDQIVNKVAKLGDSLKVFNSVIGAYCDRGLCFKGLEVFNIVRFECGMFATDSCGRLLSALVENDEGRRGLCFLGVMVRYGVVIDVFMWRSIAKVFGKEAKVDVMVRILEMGVPDSEIYDLVIGCSSEMGRFDVALGMFDEMSKRNVSPGFKTCASVLNGACRYKNDEVIKFAMESMVEEGYISKSLTEYDLVIQKLCDMKKTYAADMLIKRACGVQSSLESETYGCMLHGLSLDARVKDAIELYHFIECKGVQVDPIFYSEFINILCSEDPSKELDALLINMISKGYKPSPLTLSKYITSQCKKRRWKEAEELADLALQFLDASCGFLVKHYCKRAQIDLAINMHVQMEKRELIKKL